MSNPKLNSIDNIVAQFSSLYKEHILINGKRSRDYQPGLLKQKINIIVRELLKRTHISIEIKNLRALRNIISDSISHPRYMKYAPTSRLLVQCLNLFLGEGRGDGGFKAGEDQIISAYSKLPSPVRNTPTARSNRLPSPPRNAPSYNTSKRTRTLTKPLTAKGGRGHKK
jgi:hypothetical protein